MDPQDLYNRLHKRPPRPSMGTSTGFISQSLPHHSATSAQYGSLHSNLRLGSPDSRSHRYSSYGQYSRSTTPELTIRHEDTTGVVGDIPPPIGAIRRIVTGPPNRDHWKPDSHVLNCSLCAQPFTVVVRRHHCRRCGEVFCSHCSAYTVRLDQLAQFHPAGVISRVCKTCYNEFQSRIIPLKATKEEDLSGDEIEVPPDGLFI
ncbi:hypothetical protein HK096_006681 [Nowakowskiella sp. JEL0078]|nr:hypothetical protein HK096_006681 [Nowakowskiella sp. JEL0078]